MADRYLLENSSVDGYLLEDGSGVLLLETSVPVIPPPGGGGGGGGGVGVSPHYVLRGKQSRVSKARPLEIPRFDFPKPAPKPKPRKPAARKPKKASAKFVPVEIKVPQVKTHDVRVEKEPYEFPKGLPPEVLVLAEGQSFGTSTVKGYSSFAYIVEANMGLPHEITEEEFVFLALAS